jgi:hypothetical protein
MSSLSPKYLSVLLFSVFLLLVAGCGSSGSSDSGDNIVPPIDGSPVITVLGSNPRHLDYNVSDTNNSTFTFVDPGAEAYDVEDGNITTAINETTDVNMSVAGTYTTTYTVTDSGGNTVTAYRTELVIDPAAPFVYEDAEDNNTLGWSIYDENASDPGFVPAITNVSDVDQGSRVIKLDGNVTEIGFEFRFERYDGTFVDWNDASHKDLSMDMKFTDGENFKIIVKCDTDAGLVWVTYANYGQPASDTTVWVDISGDVTGGNAWETFSTATVSAGDLTTVLSGSGFTLQEIDGLRIKASMSVDNITTLP